MEVEKRSSKGGFLQLFDWNVKSRKKLFSNKPDLPESSKHGKENLDNLAISRLQQMELDEALHGPSLTGSDWASSMSNDEGCGTKAPGVVARLMGLDSLPTLDASDPGFTPFVDSHSFRRSLHPRTTTEFESENHFAGMRNKLDGFSRNPVEDRLQKLQNRPIERFQTEVLPPRSAKSVPITHHRMLSPIKSPGFILSRNAAYIMEAASKMIEQSPHSTLSGRLPSFGTSSVPLKIRDLKEKMEAAHRTSRIPEASQRPKVHSPASSSKLQPPDKHQCRSEVVILKQGVAESLKQKNKSVSLTTPAKPTIQKGEGTTSRNTRSNMKQKEDDVKSVAVQLDKKERNTPKRVQNRSKTGKTPEVLTQNNQKQNRASQKDRLSLKPRVPCQHDRKATSTNGFCREVKTSKKATENSAVGARKVQLATYETGKEFSLTKTKNFSGKKRPTDRDIVLDGTTANNVQMKEKERSVKCNITIDGSSNWESVDRKNGMDVVSFTFTSPIKKSVPESEPSGQSAVKSRGLCLNFEDDHPDTGTAEFPSFRAPMIDSDALSALLEQKLKELSSIVETSQCDTVRGGPTPNSSSAIPGFLPCFDVVTSASAKHDKMFHLNMQKDKSMIQHVSDVSSVDQMPVEAKLEWQGVEVKECNSNSETEESGMSHQYQHPCTLSSLEPSLSDDSCITSNSTTTLTSNGNKQCTSTRSMELLAEEIELQDSATSLPSTIFEFTSTERWSSQWEFDYIKELLIHAELVFEDFSFGHTQKVINAHLFDQLENQNKNMDPFLKVQRKALFDCVSACLESRRDRALSGSYEEWAKWSTMFQRKDLLADEIQKEIYSCTSMEDLMVDEVVDKDMSSRDGKWLDFKAEALEEGVVIQNAILTTLMDEMLTDFLCF